MCCKLPSIPELRKPRAQLCTNCEAGVGCKIYDSRPETCRAFYCLYMLKAVLGDEWKPTTCHMMVTYEAEEDRMVVLVEPQKKGVWRREPYFSQIRTWAQRSPRGHVLVWQGNSVIVVLAGREINLGPVAEGQQMIIRETHGPGGKDYDAFLIDGDDPRIRG